jgi:hypothetical protein
MGILLIVLGLAVSVGGTCLGSVMFLAGVPTPGLAGVISLGGVGMIVAGVVIRKKTLAPKFISAAEIDAYGQPAVLDFPTWLAGNGWSLAACWSAEVLSQLRGPDLSGRDLRGLDYSAAGLRQANLFRAVLSRVSLVGQNLESAYLVEAWLDSSNLDQAQLVGANLSRCNLRGAKLRGATLAGAVMHAVYLRDADLEGADLREADITGAFVDSALLHRARIDARWQNSLAGYRGTPDWVRWMPDYACNQQK